jgi:dTDP-4-amino-4,6-dideoxygalactose transaminase
MFNVLLPLARLSIDRSGFRAAMEQRAIGTGVSYEALHLSTLGRRFGGRDGQFPNAERIARETVTLPLHTRLQETDVDRVCEAAAAITAAAGR